MSDRELVVLDDVSESLRRGETLPTDWYTDPAVFRLEHERIFHRTWQYVGHADALREPGDHLCSRVGRIPIAVVRGDDGALNAFVNICRHRQHAVVSGTGNRRLLQCPYHGWTYNLDGTLRNAPRSKAEPEFDGEGIALRRVLVDTWGPLVFVNPWLDAPPLADMLGDLPELAAARGLDFAGGVHRATRSHEFRCNWKTYVENANECYHCPIAHPGLSQTIDVRPDAYVLETSDWYSAQLSHRLEAAQTADQEQFQFYYVWPNLFVGTATGAGSYAVHRLEALDVEHARLTVDYYFAPEVDHETSEEQIALNGVTLGEDRALVESVQRGLDSGAIPHGQLMPNSESLLQHFHGLVAQALA
jgi:phenylpropionate dioxygenase-like ring-hydroxylating dioxygenase large terminal subunit